MATRTMKRDWESKVITILGVEYNYNKLSAEMKDMAGFLGFGTKLVDNLAGMKAYSPEEKTAKVDKVYNNLCKGLWRVPGEGGKSSAKAERAKVMEAYNQAGNEDKATLRKILIPQGYTFPESE